MSDEDAFLEAIRSQPDDDTPRLVYADWLEERGDPRAELIRLETAMNRLPVYSEEYYRLKPERSRLRKVAQEDWLDAMGYRPIYRPMFTKLPPTTAERWRLAAEFIELWHERPVEPGDGYNEKEIEAAEARFGRPLPRALREWYEFAGRRRDVWSRQDPLTEPHYLRFDEHGHVVIRVENQGCTHWYIRREDLDEEDPSVWGGNANCEVSPTLSAFALLVLILETVSLPGTASLEGRYGLGQQFAVELGHYPKIVQCDLPQSYWFDHPKVIWEAEDILFEKVPEGWNCKPRTPTARERVDAHFSLPLTWYD